MHCLWLCLCIVSHCVCVCVFQVEDCNADWDAARFYHQTMLNHGGNSAWFAVGGSTHGAAGGGGNNRKRALASTTSCFLSVIVRVCPEPVLANRRGRSSLNISTSLAWKLIINCTAGVLLCNLCRGLAGGVWCRRVVGR